MLRAFIASNREEILRRARLRVAERSAPTASEVELRKGLPIFLDQLGAALLRAKKDDDVDHAEIKSTARAHGDALFDQGLTAEQVVHDYGDLCQVITGLAVEQMAAISAQEFRVFNLCLDDAIAVAVTTYATRRERALSDDSTERLGLLAHEMRSLLNSAMLAFGSMKRGVVAPGGSTSSMLERSLVQLQTLIDRSLADVRLDAGLQSSERISMSELVGEVAVAAALVARTRGLQLTVGPIEPTVVVEADRQVVAAALSNLLQNALKFTALGSTVGVRATVMGSRVLVEVEDQCGGLPPGKVETLLEPFVQKGHDRSGLGLGLTVCRKAMKAVGGLLVVRDLPGRGCVFALDLPLAPPAS